MIEAMARGLPCIGSRVGGIPELLDRTDLVGADDVGGLAGKISEVLSDPQRLRSMSVRNWRRAGDYLEDALRPKRDPLLPLFENSNGTVAASDRWVKDGDCHQFAPVMTQETERLA